MVGLARPAALDPKLPNNAVIFNPNVGDDDVAPAQKKLPTPWIVRQIGLRTALGAGAQTVKSTQMCSLDA